MVTQRTHQSGWLTDWLTDCLTLLVMERLPGCLGGSHRTRTVRTEYNWRCVMLAMLIHVHSSNWEVGVETQLWAVFSSTSDRTQVVLTSRQQRAPCLPVMLFQRCNWSTWQLNWDWCECHELEIWGFAERWKRRTKNLYVCYDEERWSEFER